MIIQATIKVEIETEDFWDSPTEAKEYLEGCIKLPKIPEDCIQYMNLKITSSWE